jgi:hypothetical protein
MTIPPDSTTLPAEDAPLEADLPGFSAPGRPSLDPLDPSTTTVTDLRDPSWSTEYHRDDEEILEDEQYEPPLPKPDTSPPSIGDPDVASAAAGLFALGAMLAGFALNGTIGRGSGAYVMHPDEAKAISDPLGRMAARRASVSGAQAKDLSDGLQAGVATAAYAARATMDHFATPDTQATGATS